MADVRGPPRNLLLDQEQCDSRATISEKRPARFGIDMSIAAEPAKFCSCPTVYDMAHSP